MTFDWNRSEVLALAKETCTQCQGFGLRSRVRQGAASPCNCVLRGVFRACYRRFRFCASNEKHMSMVRLELVHGKENRQTWGMKNEEYMADFILVTRKALDEFEYKIFRFHFLLGADWKLCCRRLELDRGIFFHLVYRIEQKLGKVFRELQPYPLYPLDEYFGGVVKKDLLPGHKLLQMPEPPRNRLMPPLRKVA